MLQESIKKKYFFKKRHGIFLEVSQEIITVNKCEVVNCISGYKTDEEK